MKKSTLLMAGALLAAVLVGVYFKNQHEKKQVNAAKEKELQDNKTETTAAGAAASTARAEAGAMSSEEVLSLGAV